ncbi:MAG: hypothetical protein EBQ92_00815, partial [Proteobacteria bacterium]|nr:hypothetical protein [Pseudomonadota bacterium]
MATPEDKLELYRAARAARMAAPSDSAPPVAASVRGFPPNEDWQNVEQRGGMGAFEAALTVANAPSAAVAGLLDPRSTVAGNVTTPAFDQTGYADALENRLKQGFVDLPGVGNVDITPLSRLLMTTSKADVARAATGGGSRQDVMRAAQAQTKLEPLVRVAATGLEMMTPSLFGPLGKLAKIAGKGLDTAPVRDAAASAARALLGPQENRTAAQQAVSFVPRAFLPPAPIAEVSATPAVRKVAPEIRTTLEGAQRKLIGKYGSMAEEADQLLRQYGGEARPEVALALTKAPLAAVEREIEPLQAALANEIAGSPKHTKLTQRIAALQTKGAKELADLEATLTPEEKALIGTVRGKLAERNKGLVERGILDPSKVDPTISGERYLPIVPKAGRKEATEAWDEIVKRTAKNEHPDDVARA